MNGTLDKNLRLNALVFVHPPERSKVLKIRVYFGFEEVALWEFSGEERECHKPCWLSALLPISKVRLDGDVLKLAFEIEGFTSPFAKGLSEDRRLLGLGFVRIAVTPGEIAMQLQFRNLSDA